jgi:hypothetical protein
MVLAVRNNEVVDKEEDAPLTTGDKIMKRHGWKMTAPELGNWPEGSKFVLSDEVEEIGGQMIEAFRTDLRSYKIGYVFKQKASKTGEGTVLGQVKAESELQRVLHGLDAVVIIGYDTWCTLDPDSKFRLVYHELEHLILNEKTSGLATIDHTVQEFPSVIKEFGPGQTSHVMFLAAYQQFQKDNGK